MELADVRVKSVELCAAYLRCGFGPIFAFFFAEIFFGGGVFFVFFAGVFCAGFAFMAAFSAPYAESVRILSRGAPTEK